MRGGLVLGGLGLVVLCGACSSTPGPGTPAVSTTVPVEALGPVPTADPGVSPSGIPSDAVDYYSGERLDAPAAQAVWDAAAGAGAVEAAGVALELFARPTLEYAAWWDALAPVLSAQARLDYAGTDPAQVPAGEVTGSPEVLEASSPLVVSVGVPTDVGVYTVVLSRTGAGQPWLVERLTPPVVVE